MSQHRIIFVGSGEFAIQPFSIFRKLLIAQPSLKLVGLVTAPPKLAGRKKILTPPPLLNFFQKNTPNIAPIFTPEKLSLYAQEILDQTTPDLIIVVDYGQFIPPIMLRTPRFGTINIHPSLLPKYRGATPLQSTILKGDTQTGITIQQMEMEMDAGPILSQIPVNVLPDDTRETLSRRLSSIAGLELAKIIPLLLEKQITPHPQEGTPSFCYEKDFSKAAAQIKWNSPAEVIDRFVRAMTPSPSAWTFYRGERVQINKVKISYIHPEDTLPPGALFSEEKKLYVKTSSGSIEIVEIKPAGKKTISGYAFYLGKRPQQGEGFDSDISN